MQPTGARTTSQSLITAEQKASIAPRQPKLLDRLHEALRARHYSRRTEQTYCCWVKRFIYFHNLRHPEEMAEPEINAFLTHLAVKEKVSASTQNQALAALLFLYRHVISRDVGDLGNVIRARKAQPQIPKRPRRLALAMGIPPGKTLEEHQDR